MKCSARLGLAIVPPVHPEIFCQEIVHWLLGVSGSDVLPPISCIVTGWPPNKTDVGDACAGDDVRRVVAIDGDDGGGLVLVPRRRSRTV